MLFSISYLKTVQLTTMFFYLAYTFFSTLLSLINDKSLEFQWTSFASHNQLALNYSSKYANSRSTFYIGRAEHLLQAAAVDDSLRV